MFEDQEGNRFALGLQLVLGLSPFEAGLWTVPYACAFIVGALATPLLVGWIRPAFVIAGGLVVAGVGSFAAQGCDQVATARE
jgi:DHA2 family multidrug resistance protein-like MFS transporter